MSEYRCPPVVETSFNWGEGGQRVVSTGSRHWFTSILLSISVIWLMIKLCKGHILVWCDCVVLWWNLFLSCFQRQFVLRHAYCFLNWFCMHKQSKHYVLNDIHISPVNYISYTVGFRQCHCLSEDFLSLFCWNYATTQPLQRNGHLS